MAHRRCARCKSMGSFAYFSVCVLVVSGTMVTADTRKGKVQLINATDLYGKMRKSLGSKRKLIEDAQADEIVAEVSQLILEFLGNDS